MSEYPEQTGEPLAAPVFPSTQRAPGYTPYLLPEHYIKAGLTSLDAMRERFGTDYEAVVTYAMELRKNDDSNWIEVARTKAEFGGVLMYARMLTEYGSKRDMYERVGKGRNTVSLYIDLYKTYPFAIPVLMAKAEEARAKDEVFEPTLRQIVAIGREAGEKAGVSFKEKSVYTGSNSVPMIDPAAKTVEIVDLPAGFPGTKAAPAVDGTYWTQNADYQLTTGGMTLPVGKLKINSVKTQLWLEVGGPTGYCEFNLPLLDSRATPVTLRLKSRAILMRVVQKEVQEPFPAEEIAQRVDFDAREPKKQSVFDIDPTTGTVVLTADSLLDNEFVESHPDAPTTLLDATALAGLSVVQMEPNSLFAFTINGQRFKGRAYLVRLDSEGWIAPLATPLSASDVRQYLGFPTLEVAKKDAGEELPVDDGFEALDDEKCMDYFGIEPTLGEDGVPNKAATANVERLIEDNVEQAVRLNYYRINADGVHYHNVTKIREMLVQLKADRVQATAQGFPDTQVSMNVSREDLCKAIGFPASATSDDMTGRLIELGLVLKIGKNLYFDNAKITAYVAARAEPVAAPVEAIEARKPVDEPVKAEAEDQAEDQAEDEAEDEAEDQAEDEDVSRSLARRKLVEKIGHDFDAMESFGEAAIQTVTKRTEWRSTIKKLIEGMDQIRYHMRELTSSFEAKGEVKPEVVKEDVLRLVIKRHPKMTAADIAACYVQTKTGDKIAIF